MFLLLLLGLIPMTLPFHRYRNQWFYGAYTTFFVAAVATNAEAFTRPALLNLLEHGALMLASFLFWMTAYRSAEAVTTAEPIDMLREVLPS